MDPRSIVDVVEKGNNTSLPGKQTSDPRPIRRVTGIKETELLQPNLSLNLDVEKRKYI